VPRVVFNPCGLADTGETRVEDNPWHPARNKKPGVSVELT
jgi:hypothetical protein